MRVLVIGGTAEANALCDGLRVREIPYLLSRAGALRDMPRTEHPVRVGGFGGAGGLADFLRRECVTHLVVASHPFAERIAANAVEAAARCRTPVLRVERPPWMPGDGTLWHEFGNIEEIARALPSGSRTLITLGRRGLGAFRARTDVWFAWRVMEPSGAPLPGHEIVAHPSTSVDEEAELMRTHRIDCLVAKHSGGSAGHAKIAAAERLRIALYLLRRPKLSPCPSVASVDDALLWLEAQFMHPDDS